MTERLYCATATDGTKRLIRAANEAAAYRYLARATWAVSVPTTIEVASIVAAGVRVEPAVETEQESTDAAA